MTIEWVRGDTKRCCTCKEYKLFDQFHKDKKSPGGLAYSCKSCAITRAKAHHTRRMATDPVYVAAKQDSYVKSRWGMNLEDYRKKLTAQGGACAICG